jgi:hypothetical protein
MPLGIKMSLINKTEVEVEFNKFITDISNKYKLNIKIDDMTIKNLQNEILNLQQQISKTTGIKPLKIFSPEQIKNDGLIVFNTIDSIKAKYEQLGKLTFPKQVFDPITKEMTNFTMQVEKADGTIEKLKFNLMNIAKGNEISKAWQLTNLTQVDNTASIREKVLQQEQQINIRIDQQRQKEEQVNAELQKQLENYRRIHQAQLDAYKQRYEGVVGKSEVQPYLDTYQNTLSTLKSNNDIKRASAEWAELDSKVKTASGSIRAQQEDVMSLGGAFRQAFEKFPIWVATSSVIMGLIHQIGDAFTFMYEQSKLFTNLQLEMTNTDLVFKDITNTANDYAKSMGTTTDSVMKAISVFGTYTATMDEILQKSQAAVIMANITGGSIETSADQIMGTLSQFNLASEDSMRVVDVIAGTARMLQVDYPKAVATISEGIQTVGSVANESKVPIELLSSMIGTLADKTRKGGAEIANGLEFEPIVA